MVAASMGVDPFRNDLVSFLDDSVHGVYSKHRQEGKMGAFGAVSPSSPFPITSAGQCSKDNWYGASFMDDHENRNRQD
jgi:hypothetical protein